MSRFKLLIGALLLSVVGALSIQPAAAGTPLQIQVTNVTSKSFVVSWVSAAPEDGYVLWGDSPTNITQRADDVRGATTISTIHYVVIFSAAKLPNPTYFDIVSGGVADTNAGQHYTVDRGPLLTSIPAPDTAWGPVKNADGTSNVGEAIIYYAVRDANGRGSPGVSELRSELLRSTDGEFWHVSLSALREADNPSNEFVYEADDWLYVYVQADSVQSAYQVTAVGASQPAPQMNLTNRSTGFVTPLKSGKWKLITGANAFDGSYDRGKHKDSSLATASFSCGHCSLLRWYTVKWKKGGIVSLTIDDEAFTLDGYSPGTLWQAPWTFFLAPGTHDFMISTTGTKNAQSKGKFIQIDALELR